jgi:hypothetical protein
MLTFAIFAFFAGGWWRIYGRPIPVVGNVIHVPLLAFLIAAVAGLLGFRPRRTLYALGVLSVVLALTGLWLASPIGGQWMANLLNDPKYFGSSTRSMFGVLGLLLPIGWALLGASVTNWRLAIATYLIPGVALVVGGVAIGFFGTPGFGVGQMSPWVPLYFLFEWPVIILIVMGVFGYAWG